MRTSTLFFNLLSAGLALAGCYSSGDNWGGERAAALQAAQRLCEDGTLSGNYSPNEFKYACANLSSDKKVDFRIAADALEELLVDEVYIPADDCTMYLEMEINGCAQGGQSQRHFDGVGSLTFTSDPNGGNCA